MHQFAAAAGRECSLSVVRIYGQLRLHLLLKCEPIALRHVKVIQFRPCPCCLKHCGRRGIRPGCSEHIEREAVRSRLCALMCGFL